MNTPELTRFLVESNAIEDIHHDISDGDLKEAWWFLELDTITIPELERFVAHFQPGAKLRDKPGMDVRVGNHVAMSGAPAVRWSLDGILRGMEGVSLFQVHKVYETLHPFMDCNGRSGRILWLWQMEREGRKMAPMGFMQTFYYQSLEEGR